MTRPIPAAADEATRYMASAVHLDDRLADALVAEFLSEPRRMVPPTSGVRAEVVLREAAAARLRRLLIDAAVLIVFCIFTALAFTTVAAWLAAAVAWRVSSLVVRVVATWLLGNYSEYGAPARLPKWLHWMLTFYLWGLIAAALVLATLGAAQGLSEESGPATPNSGPVAALLSAQLLLFGILFTGSLLRWRTVDRCFRFGIFDPAAAPREFVARASLPYDDRLRRFAEADARASQYSPAELVVYRGQNPFVGAGIHLDKWSWSTAMQLYPAVPDAEVPVFRPMELQDFLTKDLMALRVTPTLTPGYRFSELHVTHWAALSSNYLLHYPEAAPLLEQLDAGRNPQLKPEDWAVLMDSSPEWLRYFRGYRVEGWERQLAVSTFLHVGCQQHTLYLEWQAFVLPPIDPALRTVDDERLPVLPELWRALCETVVLPLSIPGRIGTLWRWARERTGLGRGDARSPGQAAFVFGADRTVREMGAGEEFTSFFEATDMERYLQILRDRVFDGVHRFLAENGISTANFDRAVTQISNATYIDNSNVVAGNIGGSHNAGTMGAASMSAVGTHSASST